MDSLAALVPRLSGAAPSVAELPSLPLGLPTAAVDSCASLRAKAPSLTFVSPAKGAWTVWELGLVYSLSLGVVGVAVGAFCFSL
jgi:hypothetical protein